VKLTRVPQSTTPGLVFSIVDRALSEYLSYRQFGGNKTKPTRAITIHTSVPTAIMEGLKQKSEAESLSMYLTI